MASVESGSNLEAVFHPYPTLSIRAPARAPSPARGASGSPGTHPGRWSMSEPVTGSPHGAAQEEVMLIEQTIEKLIAMRLPGMVQALRQWLDAPKEKEIAPADLAGLLADGEWLFRENRKLSSRLRTARLKQPACVEDIDYSHPRGLQKALMLELASSRWVHHHQSIILSGPTGAGKSDLACALGNKACRDGYTVTYHRLPRLFDELAQARADGTYPDRLRRLAKTQVIVLDDFGLEVLGARERKDLLEMLEDRYGVASTILTTQLDPKDWHAAIGDETIADAICDRLVNKAHRIRLTGDSMRKLGEPLTSRTQQDN